MEEINIKEILTYWITAICILTIIIGIIIYIDVANVEDMGYLHSSDILNERILKSYIIICYIIVPVGIFISSTLRNKMFYAIMIILEQLSIINDFLFFKNKIYSVYKPVFLIISILTIIFSILWIAKKINNKLMMITLLFSQLEGLNWIINNGKDTKLFSLVLTFYIFVLLLHILPIFVIKKQ